MSAGSKLIDYTWIEARFNAHNSPAIDAPSWRIAGRLRILTIIEDPRHHLHVALWLHMAAHHADAQERLTALVGHEARNDRVKGPLALAQLVRMPALEHEAVTAVLHRDAGA